MNLVKGTTKTYNGQSYAAKVAFNSKFLDYLKQNADSEAELLIDPDQIAGISSNASVFVLNEAYAVVKRLATLKTQEIISISAKKIDYTEVEEQDVSIPADKVVFISNRPLFSTAYKSSNDDSDVSGGVDSGTYVLASTAKMGLVLYWTSEDYEDVLDTFISPNVVVVPIGATTVDAEPNKFYVVTTPATGTRNFKLPDAATYKGSSITVMKLGVVALSVIPSGTDKINNGVGTDIDEPYNRLTVFSIGTEWVIVEDWIG